MDTTEKRTPYLGRRGLRDGSVTLDKLSDEVKEALSGSGVKSVTATVDNGTGVPSVDYSFEDGDLTLGFKNLKGATGSDGSVGPAGPQGASAVFDPETGNILATLENTIGSSDANAMTQKAVKKELFVGDKSILVTNVSPVNGYINASSEWKSNTTGNVQSVFIPCKPGKAYKMVGGSVDDTVYAFVKSDVIANQPDFATGVTERLSIPQGSTVIDIAPSDAAYLYVLIKSSAGDLSPSIQEGHLVSTEVEQIKEELNDQIMWEPLDISIYPDYNQEIIASSSGKWNCSVSESTTICAIKFVPLAGIRKIKLLRNAINTGAVRYAFLTATTRSQNSTPYWSKELAVAKQIPAAGVITDVPSDAEYLYLLVKYNNEDRTPSVFTYKPIHDVVRELQLESNGRYMQPVDCIQQYEHCNIDSSGDIYDIASDSSYYNAYLLRKYSITQGKTYYATTRVGANPSVPAVAYYNGNGEFIDFDENYAGTGKARAIIRQKLNIPSTAATVIIRGFKGTYTNPCPPCVYEGKDVEKETVTPFVIEYHEARIRSNHLASDTETDPTSATEITDTEVNSGWAVMWPSSYTPFGTPTQVIAMFHGAHGLVNSNVMGYYNHDQWAAWRQRYCEEGYAVIDINGTGVTTGTEWDENSRHYGCPAAVETVDKAFEYLKAHYNVCDKLLLHGSSMGGAIAQSYGFTFPKKVLAVAIFASSNTMRAALTNEPLVQKWGYNTLSEAIADDYSRFVGTVPLSKCFAWKNGELVEVSYSKIITDAAANNITPAEEWETYEFIEHYPVPIRYWQGTADETCLPIKGKKVIDSYRRGGSNATLRLVEDAEHNMISGYVPIVVEEAIAWFKRYTNN